MTRENCSHLPSAVRQQTSYEESETTIRIESGCLIVRDKVVLSGVPQNILLKPLSYTSAFLGATSGAPSSRHLFTLGVLRGYKFLSLFRGKIWWMIPSVGESTNEILPETQMLLLEARHGDGIPAEPGSENVFYILFLPLLDGPFRASLQGNSMDELQFCVESGDDNVQTSQVLEALMTNSGDNPFELIKNSIKLLEKHKGTFSHVDNKKLPAHLDLFGWCTWDAFYSEVNPHGIGEGLRSFSEGGCSPKFLIIDDGWQDTLNEFCKEGEPFIQGTQFATRLVDIRENQRFRSSGSNGSWADLQEFVKFIKDKFGIKLVYVWHALAGYWGGLLPASEKLKKYNPKLVYPIQSPGNIANLRDIAMDSIEKYGVGMIDPDKIDEFYDDLHSYLVSCGVDGVKVDVQNVMETLGYLYGGRVLLTRCFQKALERSVERNFRDNNVICCMSHNLDSIYSSKRNAVARASEDFMPREPTLQTLHVASVAFNSLFLGEVVVPDWDMFQSNHNTADFHAAARAVGGCAVYVSDKPGMHDFKILKKLVLPDGSVLRARYAGRPTRDCLFKDPVMDGKSLLKIWNLNKLTGVIGVFNCQGAGCWPLKEGGLEMPVPASILPPIIGQIRPTHVEFLEKITGASWTGDCAVYGFNSGTLVRLNKSGNLEVSLRVLCCELYTISPIRVFGEDIQFAPIGLIDMYNSGGAVEALSFTRDHSVCILNVKVRGCGRFAAYSSIKPNRCRTDAIELGFGFNPEDKFLITRLPSECAFRDVEITY